MMLKDEVIDLLKTGEKSSTEIVNILFENCPDWERPTKVKYVYNVLHKAEKWGYVKKTKTSHKTVKWGLVG